MNANDMSDFIRALQSSLTRAQTALDRRQEQTIERMIDLAEDGSPEFVTWRCPSLSGDGRVRSHELLRVPWAGLVSPTMLGISEFSVSLNRPEGLLTVINVVQSEKEISKGGKTDAQIRPASQIKIQLQGEGGRTGNIIIDDERVGAIGPNGQICETYGALSAPDRSPDRQKKSSHRSYRRRSLVGGLVIAVAVLCLAGLAVWLSL